MEIPLLSESLKHALMITGFVMVVMLIIEYVNVMTRGIWSEKLQAAPWLQIPIAALLGIIPGCLGTFTIVSLYAHRIVNFAALATVMIATSGDEAFVMMAMIPGTFFKLTILIFLIAIVTGYLLMLFPQVANYIPFAGLHKLHLHREEQECLCFEKDKIWPNLKNITFSRALLMAGSLILFLLLILGVIGPGQWNWVRIILTGSVAVMFFIVSTVPEHFLNEHIWEHIIKKHFIRIFLWTFGTLLFIAALEQYFDVNQWAQNNMHFILLIALLVGIIPESGPHMVFITLYASGMVPLSILLANSIVQDGHGSLPLLAESKKSFFWVKLINVVAGLIIGISGLVFHF